MFDVGFSELLLVGIIALLVLGPEKMPGALRSLGRVVGRLRLTVQQLREDIERSTGMDEVRQDLHNDAVMRGLKNTEYNREPAAEVERPVAENPATTDSPDRTP